MKLKTVLILASFSVLAAGCFFPVGWDDDDSGYHGQETQHYGPPPASQNPQHYAPPAANGSNHSGPPPAAQNTQHLGPPPVAAQTS